jgi:hypothetical protein
VVDVLVQPATLRQSVESRQETGVNEGHLRGTASQGGSAAASVRGESDAAFVLDRCRAGALATGEPGRESRQDTGLATRAILKKSASAG